MFDSARRARPSRPDRKYSLLALALAMLLFGGLALSLIAPSLAASDQPLVYQGTIDSTITPVMANYVERAITAAEDNHASALVFRMDTPGGLSSAMDDIIDDILSSSVPVIVWVGPRGARAASAGVYITYAAHIAAMAPGTNIGSASPVFEDSSGNVTDGSTTEQEKVTNDAVSQITNLANLRGRNAEWAASAVTDAANITAEEAVQMNVVDLEAPDIPTLLNDVNGRTVQMSTGPMTLSTANADIHVIDPSLGEQFLQLLSNPTIAYLLVSFGLLGLYLEISHPGVTLPGVLGGLMLLVGLFSLGTLPVNWAGFLLMALAFILFAADLFLPSAGTLTIGGLISFVLGSYLLLGSHAPPGYHIERAAIWSMTACLVGFSLFLGAAVLRNRLRPVATGTQTLIGAIGDARTNISPRGMVFVRGELWEARLESNVTPPINAGDHVTVTAINGLQLSVRPATVEEVTNRAQVRVDRRRVLPTDSRESGQPAAGAQV